MSRIVTIAFVFLVLTIQSCADVSQGGSPGANEIPGYENHAAPGASAKDILTNTNYTKIVIEIQSVGAATTTVAAQNNLKSFLETYVNKSDGIEIAVDLQSIKSPAKSAYTFDDIALMEKNYRIRYTDPTNKTLVLYYIILDKPFQNDSGSSSKLLGLAYQNTSIAIFESTIQSLSGGITEPSTDVVETTVMKHEVGHLMGLVSNGSPMITDHDDSLHPGHCSASTCLMYYTANTSDILANLMGGSSPSLDTNCVTDLHANGGK